MKGEDDMHNPEDFLQEIRNYYTIIYDWHTKIGLKMYKRKFEKELLNDNQNYRRYLNLLEKMPPSHKADIEIISHVAHEVLCGCMEWSYWEEVKPDLPLNHIAKYILSIVNKLATNQTFVERDDILKRLRNISTDKIIEPDYVEVDLPLDNLTIETYREYALLAYSDVIQESKVENLGGQVALGDTNLEHEHGRSHHESGRLKIKFRNSKAMHFDEESDENSLNSLAKSGAISILSVKIGV